MAGTSIYSVYRRTARAAAQKRVEDWGAGRLQLTEREEATENYNKTLGGDGESDFVEVDLVEEATHA